MKEFKDKVAVFNRTQVAVAPPTIVIFVNDPLLFPPDYRRSLGNRFREYLPFDEIPVRIFLRRRQSSPRGEEEA